MPVFERNEFASSCIFLVLLSLGGGGCRGSPFKNWLALLTNPPASGGFGLFGVVDGFEAMLHDDSTAGVIALVALIDAPDPINIIEF